MKETLVDPCDAGSPRSTIGPPTKLGAGPRGLPELRSNPISRAPRFVQFVGRATAMLGVVTLFGIVSLHPLTAWAVTCQPAERGTLSGSTFRTGTTSSHNDYRVSCTGDTNGQGVTAHDLNDAFNHVDADAVANENGRLVIDLTRAYLDVDAPRFPIDRLPKGGIVVLGTEGGASHWNHAVNVNVSSELSGNLELDSYATISATDGAYAVRVRIEDELHRSRHVRVRNFGSIEISGGGASRWNRGVGVEGTSQGGSVEVVNATGAKVVTRGPGARGIVAGTFGSVATATNHGTVTTHGNPHNNERADGVFAFAIADYAAPDGGVARATNEGTVTTHGLGANGVLALSGLNGGAGTASIATNRGTVTTRGNQHGNDPAEGVRAKSDGGLARTTNEDGATIRTYGIGARGMHAENLSFTGQAEAENWGTITTSGQHGNTGAHGISAHSRENSAYAVNHLEATVTTSGRGATGVQASAGGGPDETSVALNRGTVTMTGNTFHDATRASFNAGVAAFSDGGAASVVAENAYEGVVTASGTGVKGVTAISYFGTGAATARNRGRITIRGNVYLVDRPGTDNDTSRSPVGLQSYSRYSDATAINEVGGVIETHGTVGHGVRADADGGGSATVVNRGRVTTRGGAVGNLPGEDEKVGARGVWVSADNGTVRVVNDTTGRVDTHGEKAFAVFAYSGGDGSRTSTMAEGVNRGRVHARGEDGEGVLIVAHSGTAENPNHARAFNASGASIATEDKGAIALSAWILATGGARSDAHGTAVARNDGTIAAGGEGGPSEEAGRSASNGVTAGFFPWTGTTIANAGDVTVVNTGDVTVRRQNASGLYAETFGSGKATVEMTGGSVRAEGANGRGVWARTGTTGEVEATIAGGAEVVASGTNGIAAEFDGGTTGVRLLGSRLDGKVVFGAGTDTFTIRDGHVTGAIDFGAGTDTLSVRGDTWLDGALSNLETLTKRGSGNLVLGGDASFSSGAGATVENGGLVYTGQFNLGTTGTIRIHDPARLTAVLVDPDAPPQITAGGGITFDGDEELFVQVAQGISATDESTYLDGFDENDTNPIANGTTVTGRTGRVALRTARGPSTVDELGHIPLENGATKTTDTSVTSGVRLGVFHVDAPADRTDVTDRGGAPGIPDWSPGAQGGGLMLGGGLGTLGSALFGVFDAMAHSFAEHDLHEGIALPMPGYFGARATDEDVEYWWRSWTGGTPLLAGGTGAQVQGAEMGFDRRIGPELRLGISVAPEISTSDAGARLEGGRYAVRGAWRGERFHAGASVSRGRYRAGSVLDNPVAGGGLAGAFGVVQDHVQLGAGARLELRGVRLTPSFSMLSGALLHEAHTAEGASFQAEVPAYSQRYRGFKSELGVTLADWRRGPRSLRWRPVLNLHAQRLETTGSRSLEVAQHDRAGVLSLTSRAEVAGLPRTVHGLTATVDALHRDGWRAQLGLAAMQTDGESDHAVFARMHLRF